MANRKKIEEKLETQKFEYLENEKSFLDDKESIFHTYLKLHSQVLNYFWKLRAL